MVKNAKKKDRRGKNPFPFLPAHFETRLYQGNHYFEIIDYGTLKK